MDIVNYETIVIECDGILVNHYQGILNKIYELQQNLPQNIPFKRSLIQTYLDYYHNQSGSVEEYGFCALHCFSFQALMESYHFDVNWRRTFQFGRAMKHWPLFEDAYGALHYFKKFFHVLLRCDREPEDIHHIINKLGISKQALIVRNETKNGLADELNSRGINIETTLLITTADIAENCHFPNTKIIHRSNFKEEISSKNESLASLVVQHQNTIRNSWH